MKTNYLTLSRCLIALLFVVAGIGKAMTFAGVVNMLSSNFGSLATIVTALVIVIEIPVALAYAYGRWYGDYANYILMGFTVLATIMYHLMPAVAAQGLMGVTDVNVLKNIAILGGLLATLHCVRRSA